MAIPAPATAARRTASLVVERYQLVPPVSVEELLRERAVVHRVPWPHDGVDAVLLGLHASPVVYVRATDNLLRERFTLAHELGHLFLPWHLARPNCKIGTGNLDLDSYSVEDEADVFASCLLVPDVWLIELLQIHDGSMSDVVRELNSAEVTTIAALLALRRVLLAGWVFVGYGDQIVSSPGTHIDGLQDASLSDALDILEEECVDEGSALLNAHRIRWFRMFEPEALPVRDPSDSRSLHVFLLDALSLIEPDEDERLHLVRVCNGKIGGTLRDAAGRPARETYNALKYRFEKSHVAYLLELPDFLVWLAEKTRDVESGGTKKKQSAQRSAR